MKQQTACKFYPSYRRTRLSVTRHKKSVACSLHQVCQGFIEVAQTRFSNSTSRVHLSLPGLHRSVLLLSADCREAAHGIPRREHRGFVREQRQQTLIQEALLHNHLRNQQRWLVSESALRSVKSRTQ